MEYEKWGLTTYIFWFALLVAIWVPDHVTLVATVAFVLSLIWQGVQFARIGRQHKAKRTV